MLTPEQRDEFDRCGILRVPGAVPARDAEAMCDQVWRVLSGRYGAHRNDPESWKAQRIAGWKDFPKSMTFAEVGSSAMRAIFDALLGSDEWEEPEHWASLLVSFPGAYPPAPDGWSLPREGWHLDAPVVRALPHLYGLRIFTCLAKIDPRGGATLVVAGSHRLAQGLANSRSIARIRSADVRKGLIQRYRWVKELCSADSRKDRVEQFMRTATKAEDVDLRVVEMTGDPGDVYLMHPLMMHAASPNCLGMPRIALTTTIYKRGVDWRALYDAEAAANA